MKKLLYTCLFTIIVSVLFGNYIFSSYKKSIEKIVNASISSEKIYMLLYGSYNSLDKVKNINLDNYILEEENGFYKVYVGITKNEENLKKLREIYKEKGNIIYVREKYISNLELIDYIMNSESNFDNISNEEILSIEKNIINKYKEFYE